MYGYTKLFESIVTSTIWQLDDKTRIVWVTMLALKNGNHEVEASVPGLARVAGVDVEDCRRALEKLKSPDPDSRSLEYEGRRICDVSGGWRILNGAKYQERLSADERREYNRRKQEEYRKRKKEAGLAGAQAGAQQAITEGLDAVKGLKPGSLGRV